MIDHIVIHQLFALFQTYPKHNPKAPAQFFSPLKLSEEEHEQLI